MHCRVPLADQQVDRLALCLQPGGPRDDDLQIRSGALLVAAGGYLHRALSCLGGLALIAYCFVKTLQQRQLVFHCLLGRAQNHPAVALARLIQHFLDPEHIRAAPSAVDQFSSNDRNLHVGGLHATRADSQDWSTCAYHPDQDEVLPMSRLVALQAETIRVACLSFELQLS